MSMLICCQWFLLQSEAVLLNPSSPGTERILSQALTAVMLQHCFFNNFLSHPPAHPLCTSLPLLSHFPNLYSLSTSLSNLIYFSSISPSFFPPFIYLIIYTTLSVCSSRSLLYSNSCDSHKMYLPLLHACIVHTWWRLMHFFFPGKASRMCLTAELPKYVLISAIICAVPRRILLTPSHIRTYVKEMYEVPETRSFVSQQIAFPNYRTLAVYSKKYASVIGITVEGTSKAR